MWQGPWSFIGPSQGLARRRAEARFLHQRGLSFAVHVPYLCSTFEQVKPFHCFGLSLKNTSIRRIWRSQHRQPVAVISKRSEMWSLMTYFSYLFLLSTMSYYVYVYLHPSELHMAVGKHGRYIAVYIYFTSRWLHWGKAAGEDGWKSDFQEAYTSADRCHV